jgi:hypothetical protein
VDELIGMLVHLEAVEHQPSLFWRGCVNIFQFSYIITDLIPRHNLGSLPHMIYFYYVTVRIYS